MSSKTNSPIVIRTARGVAHRANKSEGWARLGFKSGAIPTEYLIEGTQPAIAEASLKALPALNRK
jgi:hypothetical protein